MYDQLDDSSRQEILGCDRTAQRADHLRQPDTAVEFGCKIINCRLQPSHNLGPSEPLRRLEGCCHDHLDVTPIAGDELMDRQGGLLGRLIQEA